MKTATAPLPPLRSVKVLDQLRERIRYLHYSLRTEQAYVNWVRAFIRFHGVRHPATLGSSEVEAFLSWLANERKVSVSTHRQALAALLFFYGKVLCTDLPWLQEIGRPRPSRRLPVVLTPDEVVRILGFLEGEHRLFAQLLYGTGMRISEGLQLRVRIWISITARSSCGRARAPGSGLDVTRELGTQPARAAVACTGMVAEGPGRGPQRRCASRRP
ncbi:Tyrosine recombinase XerC [Escherichia coli]|nr:Tyrosine recombinase XerC [Escherichia coli]VCZ56970.1 Tyrosine recombinase XerC [Acinetobacter baumannii]